MEQIYFSRVLDLAKSALGYVICSDAVVLWFGLNLDTGVQILGLLGRGSEAGPL